MSLGFRGINQGDSGALYRGVASASSTVLTDVGEDGDVRRGEGGGEQASKTLIAKSHCNETSNAKVPFCEGNSECLGHNREQI